jgi:hypothetical protein
MYIAGTHTKRDAYDDITKFPSFLRDAPYYFPTLKHYEKFIYGLNKVAPNIANKIDNNLPFSHLGDVTESRKIYKRRKGF